MRILTLCLAAVLVASPALADDEDKLDYDDYLDMSESQRVQWMGAYIEYFLPEASAERRARILPGMASCVDDFDHDLPTSFWMWAGVCLDLAAEKVE
ncbi:hypothetical protein W911_09985 [Hyphomicrobium nitrativorans NL23]|uniref:Uncharacterized protein n=1 Tax=Hyphomicrobium nitrativorans NL23 TaxID=1029756 RepID=V5SJN5_9HYPH|nr:hypothetical protein [Hyphomicrobium nitrativorans]AHB50179.1 hypothetical protein W911_09985 [Hyphomicrobium nitrativorans NL23]